MVLIILLLLMYESFQPTPLRASSQIREGLILLLFLVYFCVAGDCVCLYNHQSHIFDYFYMLLRDDCFLSIINRACVSLQFPIDDLYLPLWKCYIAISCDRVDRQRILCLFVFFVILVWPKQDGIAYILLMKYIYFLETMDRLLCCHLKFCFVNDECPNCFYIFIFPLLVNPTFVPC